MKRANETRGQQDTDFLRHVRKHVLDVLGESSLTFEQILKRSLNCDPALLLQILDELRKSRFISATRNNGLLPKYKLLNQKRGRRQNLLPSYRNAFGFVNDTLSSVRRQELRKIVFDLLNGLPEPSPTYYQWWFSNSAYEKLIKLVLSFSKGRTPIAFLGSSTLGALSSHFSKNDIVVFDIDEVLLSNLSRYCSEETQLVRYDASEKLKDVWKDAFQLVFIDPPWSTSILKSFLVMGASLAKKEGKIAISLPQMLTRPAIPSERKELLQLATELGLSLELVLPSFTEYAIPFFEYNAYKQCGIELRNPWRKGDLLIFTKTNATTMDYSHLIEHTPKWEQFQKGKSRIFLKRDGRFEDGPPSIKPVSGFKDFVYSCTSSRLSSWKSASLVSTNNCIAHAHGRQNLSIFLKDVIEKSSKNRKEDEYTSATFEQIEKTILSMLSSNHSDRK